MKYAVRSLLVVCTLIAGACSIAGPGTSEEDDNEGSGGTTASVGQGTGGAVNAASGPASGPAATTGSGPTTTTGAGPATTTGPTSGAGGGGPANCVMVGGAIECDPFGGACNGAGSVCDVANTQAMGFVTSCFPPPNDATLGGACDNENGPFCGAGLACAGGTCTEYCCSNAQCSTGTCAVGGHDWSGAAGLESLGICQ